MNIFRLMTQVIFAILLLFAGSVPLLAQSTDSLSDSGLTFKLGGQDPGLFNVATVNASPNVFRYVLGAQSEFLFRLADGTNGTFDNPLICFDFSTGSSSAVGVSANNSSGQVALNGVLDADLTYGVTSGEVTLVPSANTQCFYVGTTAPPAEAQFGLFGVAPETADGNSDSDVIFSDGFEASSSVSVSFENVPESVEAGAQVTYDLVISNNGSVGLNELAFAEVFPGNPNYFSASLDAGDWTCTSTNGASCPAATGTGPLRLSSPFLSLSAGESLTYQISRTVGANATGGSSIFLFAGAVDGAGPGASFDVAEAEISVVGTVNSFEVVFDPTPPTVVAGGTFPDFTITAIDNANNTVNTFNEQVGLTLRDASVPLTVLNTQGSITWTNGVATISGLAVPSGSAGSPRLIRVEFSGKIGDSESFTID